MTNIAVFDTDVSTTIDLSSLTFGSYIVGCFSKTANTTTIVSASTSASSMKRSTIYSKQSVINTNGNGTLFGNINTSTFGTRYFNFELNVTGNNVYVKLYQSSTQTNWAHKVHNINVGSKSIQGLPTGYYVVLNKIGGLPNETTTMQLTETENYLAEYKTIEKANGADISDLKTGIYEIYCANGTAGIKVLDDYLSVENMSYYTTLRTGTGAYVQNILNTTKYPRRSILIVAPWGHCIYTFTMYTTVDSSADYSIMAYKQDKVLGSGTAVTIKPLVLMP